MSKDKVTIVFVVRFDVLGQKYHTNLHPTARSISDSIIQEPVNSDAVVIAPTPTMMTHTTTATKKTQTTTTTKTTSTTHDNDSHDNTDGN